MAVGIPTLVERLRANIAMVQERIARAAARAGRDPAAVTIVAVAKTFGPPMVEAAYAAGLRHFGENRVQEAEEKLGALDPTIVAGSTWHLVGHLQTNKARLAARLFQVVQSIDSLRVAQALEQGCARAGTSCNVLIQVNLARTPGQFGLPEEMVAEVARGILALPHLRLRGLMTIAPQVEDAEQVRPHFRRLRELAEQLRRQLPQASWDVLSMGMTEDFEVAVEEGATMVRLGRAIFGERH
ncbi:MAG: YggS family pyridoxal phosphate-dependent enzyme [Chloroflexota bacterium]